MFGPLSLHKALPSWIASIVQGATILAVGLMSALYVFQGKLLYVPRVPGISNTYQETPSNYDLGYSEEVLQAADGTRLNCWLVWGPSGTPKKPPVVLYFQENAGNMSHRTHFIAKLASHLKCAVFVLGYRGYGKSEGTPSQAGLEQDAAAALQHLQQRGDVDASRIVLFGRSLGGAVALHLIAKQDGAMKAAIIENTFTSVGDMAARMLPFLGPMLRPNRPLHWMIKCQWQNADCIQKIRKTPLLLLCSAHVCLIICIPWLLRIARL
jgi:abhydrolase domain-containing protein 13